MKNTYLHRGWPGLAAFRKLTAFVYCSLALTFASSALAQSGQTGLVTGRVFNPTTGEYVRSAQVSVQGTNQSTFTEAGGYYSLANVPAGAVTLVVNYTGYETTTATVNVGAGTTVTHNFDLAASTASASSGEVLQLGEFVVSSEREGNAKAIMEQKAAMNVKNVVASDSFGEIAEGNIGEFLKFMPGIVLDYVETDTRAARMGGMEARYGAVTLDGNSVANAGGDSRQFEFEAMSISNIEAIEVNKTLSADMPADAPAGSINLRTKSALDRKDPQFNFYVGFIGNQYGHSFGETAGPDDEERAKSRPTFTFDYSTKLGEKLGIAFNGSYSSVYKLQYRHSVGIDYTSATAIARGKPIINALNFKDGAKITDKYSAGLKLDYEPFGPQLRLTLTSSYTDFSDMIPNRNLAFAVNVAQVDPSSTLTKVIANPSTNANTNVNHSGGTGNKQIDTSYLAGGFVYRAPNYTIDGQMSYSRARLQNGSDHLRQLDRANLRLSRIGWTAERSDIGSTAWTITQTSGLDWSDLDNYGTADVQANNIVTGRSTTKSQEFVEQLNLRYILPFRVPSFIKTGVQHRVFVRTGERRNQITKTWVGPTGNQLTSPMPASIQGFRISQAFGGNIYSLPAPDKTALYDLLWTRPEYFTQTEAQRAGDLDSMLEGRSQNVQEEIMSGYVMGNTRVGRFQFQAGVRYEGTETTAYSNLRIPDADNPFPANTINRILYRWSQGRERKEGSYHDFLPSAAATYRISDDFILKAGYHKAIKRPPLNQLAGTWDVDEAEQRVEVANPNLKPERSEKISLLLEHYFEPAGVASVHVFQSDLENSAERTEWLPASEFGYGDHPIYGTYEFRGWQNFPGVRKFRGLELDYKQQLSFFSNELLRSIGVFATYARYTSDPRPNNFVEEKISAGINFRYRRFSANFRGTWTPDVLTGSTIAANSVYFPGDREAKKERYLYDLDLTFKLTRRFDLLLSGRNIFNSPIVWYFPESDGRMRQTEKFGGQWTAGVRGRF